VAPSVLAEQKQKPGTAPQATPKSTELSAEQKEILKHRELLENLELLMNFEQIKYLDFFAEKRNSNSKEKPGTRSQAKEDAAKNPK
jgi:hypothetical protein